MPVRFIIRCATNSSVTSHIESVSAVSGTNTRRVRRFGALLEFWAIQCQAGPGTAWTRRSIGGKIPAMPRLTDLELETAARACRALACQEEQAAKRMENPGMGGPVENTAKRAAALAEKFEAAQTEP
jgi:hypothetical protein